MVWEYEVRMRSDEDGSAVRRSERLQARIAELPSGYISRKTISGKVYPYYQWTENGKLKSRYVKKDELASLEEQIQQRKELQAELRSLGTIGRLSTYKAAFYMKQKVPVGIQEFDRLIERDLFYIDKTDFIREWWESETQVTLITRPRRFGKTLTLSMVNCFFSREYAGRSDLFEGLSIWTHTKYHELQGTYPVVYLSFAGIKGRDVDEMKRMVRQLVIELYSQYEWLEEHLQGRMLEFFRQVTYGMSDDTLQFSLHHLTRMLSDYYGKRVIVLLDEYDVPMQEAWLGGFWGDMMDLMRPFLNLTFKNNRCLEKGLITGITRISRESLFSDLNHLDVISTLTPKYQTAFGFTEEEVFRALEAQQLGSAEMKQQVKDWYDGFCFGGVSGIYNPWSIIQFLNKRTFDRYWVNTSSNALVRRLLAGTDLPAGPQLENLLLGGSIRAEVQEDIVYQNIDGDENTVWNFLLACGYLKMDGQNRMTVTNREVREMMLGLIRGWFAPAGNNYSAFIRAMLAGDSEAMTHYMNEIALRTFSTFDVGEKPSAFTVPERFYHGFVLGLLVELEADYQIRSNRESGFRRYDVMILPKNLASGKKDGYIMEFKVYNPSREKNLEETCEAALEQIHERRYAEELTAQGIEEKHIHNYGFAFAGKQVLVKAD